MRNGAHVIRAEAVTQHSDRQQPLQQTAEDHHPVRVRQRPQEHFSVPGLPISCVLAIKGHIARDARADEWRQSVSYYFARTIEASFEDAVSRTREALKAEGFGVITEIDVRKTLKTKIDVDFRPYLILGACNPAMAYEALQVEDKVGTMLPCNVVVQQLAEGHVEVAAIDPVASMQAIRNPALTAKAAEVAAKLESALGRI